MKLQVLTKLGSSKCLAAIKPYTAFAFQPLELIL